jgi:2-phosphoglycerate kinase
MHSKIFLYGVPGVGKTYLSKKLAKIYKLPVIELDKLRIHAQEGKLIETDPFLFLGTTEAYKVFGKPTKQNILRGLNEVRDAFNPLINDSLDTVGNKQFIAESAFIKPDLYKNQGIVILIIQPDIDVHKKQFFTHRKNNEEMRKSFLAARVIQDYLQKEAKEKNIATRMSSEEFQFPT